MKSPILEGLAGDSIMYSAQGKFAGLTTLTYYIVAPFRHQYDIVFHVVCSTKSNLHLMQQRSFKSPFYNSTGSPIAYDKQSEFM